MKKQFLLVAFSLAIVACNSTDEVTSDPKDETIEFGDPGTQYDNVKINSLEDKVAYSVGYNSSEDAKQFLNSIKYHRYFDRAKTRDGFFTGIEKADSITAQEYNGLLKIYFQTQGSFDTTNIKPADASFYIGYLRGYELKRSFEIKNVADKFRIDVMRKGYKDGLWDTQPLIPIEEQQVIITEFFSSITKAEGEQFLAENKKNKGVIETATGLQYSVIKPGKGPKPNANSKVFVYYTLRDINNRIIETNADQPKPIDFYLNKVIPGWTEGLQLMQKGGQYKLFVPYELAYGASGSGNIQPYSALIFEIELVDIE